MALDITIMVFYIIIINLIGLKFSKSGSMKEYFLGDRSISWPVACFSIVATETSTLTFISIPGLAYITNLGFLQIALGYIIGRVLVAKVLLPNYFAGEFETAYGLLQNRFSFNSRRIIAVIFHITRLLADSVRLFATAIPLALLIPILFGMENSNTTYMIILSILIIGIATFIYTFVGGIKSVTIVDSVQLFLYLFCAIVGVMVISSKMDLSAVEIFNKIPDGKAAMFFTGAEKGIWSSYNILSGLIGGLFLSFASHGTDHLIVQRVLSCKDLKSAQKAMVFSGILVFFQFALFMLLGLFIYVFLDGKTFDKPDMVMPHFIVNSLSPGFRGLMLAGIFAAAMSTLSSSINSLSSSTSMDILRIPDKDIDEKKKVRISRYIALIWTIIIMGISILLRDNKNPLVELGLAIASITYGGMLGIFIQAILIKDFDEKAALSGVIISIIAILIIANTLKVFWPWFVPIGFVISFFCGLIINFILKRK